MFTLVNKKLLRNCLIYVGAVVLTAAFGAIYESFSHEVYSYFMLYAFAVPLVLGVIPTLCAALFARDIPLGWGARLYNSGAAALTVGSIFEGVLEIYGTTNRLMLVYIIAGAALLLVGIAVFIEEQMTVDS